VKHNESGTYPGFNPHQLMTRQPLAGIVERWQLVVGFGVSCLIFLIGVMVFRRTERTFADLI
jgi:hypothetical protein